MKHQQNLDLSLKLGLYAVPYTVYGRIGTGGVRLRDSRTRNRTVLYRPSLHMGSGVTCFDQLFMTSKPNFWRDKGPDLFRISFLGATGPKISTFLPKTTLQMELWP